MARHIGWLAALVPLAALSGCLEPLDDPVLDLARTGDEEEWEDPEPAPDGEAAVRPTCSYALLREGEDEVAFAVEVEGVVWERITLEVEDDYGAWGLLLDEIGPTIAVPFDLSGTWSVEAMVHTPEGDALPCGSLAVRSPE